MASRKVMLPLPHMIKRSNEDEVRKQVATDLVRETAILKMQHRAARVGVATEPGLADVKSVHSKLGQLSEYMLATLTDSAEDRARAMSTKNTMNVSLKSNVSAADALEAATKAYDELKQLLPTKVQDLYESVVRIPKLDLGRVDVGILPSLYPECKGWVDDIRETFADHQTEDVKAKIPLETPLDVVFFRDTQKLAEVLDERMKQCASILDRIGQRTGTARSTAEAKSTAPVVVVPPTAPTEPDAAPAEPDAAPTEPDAAPTEHDAAPAEPDAAPVEPDAAPVEPDAAPVEPDAAPTEPERDEAGSRRCSQRQKRLPRELYGTTCVVPAPKQVKPLKQPSTDYAGTQLDIPAALWKEHKIPPNEAQVQYFRAVVTHKEGGRWMISTYSTRFDGGELVPCEGITCQDVKKFSELMDPPYPQTPDEYTYYLVRNRDRFRLQG
jgi:hypothetical protein